ncbi:MAG: riboflavin synthase [Crocinitomicaceae bacterium]|nr:riboflavin synthase [Crocinitomicaceae bacterium]
MFTGIIEATGKLVQKKKDGSNIHFMLEAPFISEMKIDQSVAHDGVCLTVVGIEDHFYTVTAIEETLSKTNLGEWEVGNTINLERCLKIGDRLDGHIVQGHVDQTAICDITEAHKGSGLFGFTHDIHPDYVTIPKGSITVNGVSLTVVDSSRGFFTVAIIPYTLENTNFSQLKKGSKVNLEFDIIGKYISRYLAVRMPV